MKFTSFVLHSFGLVSVLASPFQNDEPNPTNHLSFPAAKGPVRSTLRLDLGKIDPIDRPVLSQSIRLKNDGPKAVTINKVESTCGCSSITIDGNRPEAGSITIGPRQKATIQISHLLYLVRPGRSTKYVWLYVLGHKVPAATIEIAIDLKPCVRFSPSTIAIRTVKSGAAPTVRVEALVNKRLLGHGAHPFPRLACSDPDVAVAEVWADKNKPVQGWERKVYSLSLSRRAALGAHFATLSYQSETNTVPEQNPRPFILAQAKAIVSFRVEGRISANPSFSSFGEVTIGSEHINQVKLRGKDDMALKGLQVTSGAPWLIAEVRRTANPRKAMLVLWLLGTAPVGAHETQVQLQTIDGQRLTIQVSVNVQK